MTLSFQRCIWSGVLTIWGVLLTYFYASGRVASYLHPSFHLWMAVCGVVLLLMAIGVLFLPDVDISTHGNSSNMGGTPVRSVLGQLGLAGVLVVPLIVATGMSPGQFGAATVNNRGVIEDISKLPGYQPYSEPALPTADGSTPAAPAQASPPADYMPKTPDGLIKAQTVDLMYAAQEPSMRSDFENKEVEMIGQFMPSRTNNASGNRFSLVRMFITCCAADARPVAVNIQTASPTKMTDMSWVKITGKATFPIEGGRSIPVVVADSVKPCDPPEDTFIY
jgi:uncharacterized repeat protein (TIGR03943 family)